MLLNVVVHVESNLFFGMITPVNNLKETVPNKSNLVSLLDAIVETSKWIRAISIPKAETWSCRKIKFGEQETSRMGKRVLSSTKWILRRHHRESESATHSSMNFLSRRSTHRPSWEDRRKKKVDRNTTNWIPRPRTPLVYRLHEVGRAPKDL